MTRWTSRFALEHVLAHLARAVTDRQRPSRRRAARPLDVRHLSPHLARDIGLLDAGSRHLAGDAHGRMGQLLRLR